jgi:AraC-like DNA-binding protein
MCKNDYSLHNLIPDIEYFVHRKCTASWILEERKIHTNEIVYIISGEAEYIIENKPYHVTEGDVLYVPKNTHHSANLFSQNLMECYAISFHLYNNKGEESELHLPTISKVGVRPDLIAMYGDFNSSWLIKRREYKTKCAAIFIMLLLRYYELILFKKMHIPIDPRVDKIVRLVTDNYAHDLSVETVSKSLNLHPNYFSSLFKTATGLSFRQFLTSVRINNAEILLKDGQFNIAEVAELCGYSDVCYFSRVYKKSRGIPPSKVAR